MATAEPEDLVNFSLFDDPEIVTFVRGAITALKKNGYPWQAGNTRVVFHRPRSVVKIPITDGGLAANAKERHSFTRRGRAGYLPTAACRLITDPNIGMPILVMERLNTDTIHNAPDWVSWIDSGQVGLNRRGEIVAYDL